MVKCTGHETNLGQCTKKPANYSRDAAGVVCLSHKEDVIIKPQASEASGGVRCRSIIHTSVKYSIKISQPASQSVSQSVSQSAVSQSAR